MNIRGKHRSWNNLGLPVKICRALRRSGFVRPTSIQEQVIPCGLKGRDIVAIAPAGTGKTLAYLLPLWNNLDASWANALVLIPTRELAFQVSQMLQQLAPKLHERCVVTVGGKDIGMQLRQIRRNRRLIIATPGRLIDICKRESDLLKNTRILVLDEYDKLLKLGFQPQIREIHKFLEKPVQTMLFSATRPEDEEMVKGTKKTIYIDLTPVKKQRTCEEFFYMLKSSRAKNMLCLDELKESFSRVIVFVKNKNKANHVHGYLRLHKIPCQMLHGKMKQPERSRIYQNLMDGRIPVLIATDLASRGLDTLHVDLVINFNLPQSAADYMHRKGRAGRRNRPGLCLSFAGPEEYLHMRNIEKGLPYPIQCHPDYNQKEKWYINAKAHHKKKVRREQRIALIKKEQGL
jgi:superfamily II DNA/RNA helicase